MFARAISRLNALSPAVVAGMLTGLALMVGFVDYLAGTDATFSVLYLFPIAAAAWFFGRVAGLSLAVLSSVLWLSGDLAAGAQYKSLVVPMWNLAARFVIFLFAALLVSEFRKLHNALERRAAERAAKLTAEIAARERLERELLEISEREQQRVGHDIHDSLCQQLTGTAFAGQVLAETLRAKNAPEADDAFRLVKLIEDSIFLARNLARGLSGVELANNGLIAALSDFAATTSDLFNISCRFQCRGPFPVEDLHAAAHLYRIAQEAVSNAIKHGDAKNIVIELDSSGSAARLRILDDGTGLAPERMDGKGMGLRIMAYRSELIGAKLDIRPRDTRGTVVTCMLPLEEVAA